MPGELPSVDHVLAECRRISVNAVVELREPIGDANMSVQQLLILADGQLVVEPAGIVGSAADRIDLAASWAIAERRSARRLASSHDVPPEDVRVSRSSVLQAPGCWRFQAAKVRPSARPFGCTPVVHCPNFSKSFSEKHFGQNEQNPKILGGFAATRLAVRR